MRNDDRALRAARTAATRATTTGAAAVTAPATTTAAAGARPAERKQAATTKRRHQRKYTRQGDAFLHVRTLHKNKVNRASAAQQVQPHAVWLAS
jgi:hypothetical protein